MKKSITAYSSYAQVGIWGKDSPYPQFQTGNEPYVFNDFGIVVPVKPDANVRLTVVFEEDVDVTQMVLLVETKLKIGQKGVEFGNEVAATKETILLPIGEYLAKVYVNSNKNAFVLNLIILLRKIP